VFNLFLTGYGWDIVVWDKRDPKADLSCCPPPYRFFNPRYIGAIYGYSAAEAIVLTPRIFHFVVNREDHAKALAPSKGSAVSGRSKTSWKRQNGFWTRCRKGGRVEDRRRHFGRQAVRSKLNIVVHR
jgi:hypothetical protein